MTDSLIDNPPTCVATLRCCPSSPERVSAMAGMRSYSALWLPEAVGRDPFSFISHLAAHTQRLVFATGIANIYARDAMTMRAIQQTVGELSGGRFVLGLGVSHAPLVAGLRGHAYGKPVATMRAYLEAMEKAMYVGPAPAEETPIVLAALRPRML